MEEPSSEPRESSPANLVALKTAATALRDQIYRLEREEEFKSGGRRVAKKLIIVNYLLVINESIREGFKKS